MAFRPCPQCRDTRGPSDLIISGVVISSCPICLHEAIDSEDCTVLWCGHITCTHCHNTWQNTHLQPADFDIPLPANFVEPADELRTDREVVMAAVRNNREALYRASPELRADREVVMAAVSNHGSALNWASPELRADRDIVMAAVRNDGYALSYASLELQADREVNMVAATAIVMAADTDDDTYDP